MESQKSFNYHQLIKKIKNMFECKFHNNKKYIAYCITCRLNICDKCLNNNLLHINHKIFYFEKIKLSERHNQFYRTLYFLCKKYLTKVREIIIELFADLSEVIKEEKNPENYILLLNYKSQLKNSYKFFYKINTYQMYYAKNILTLYFYCRKWGYINFQIINNMYNIKLNSVRIPDFSGLDIINKIRIMIDFLQNNKSKININILRSSNSENPSTFYSYINYNNIKSPTIYTNNVKLSPVVLDMNKGEIFFPQKKEINNLNSSASTLEKEETENVVENDNIYNNNLEKSNKNTEDSLNGKIYEDEDLKHINNRVDILEDNSSKINIIFKTEENINEKSNEQINKEISDDDKNIKENKNKNKINYEEDNSEKEIRNIIAQNEKIKNYIYASLPKPCNEEVEYRDSIKYIYLDKNGERQINCVYYGEFKKGSLKRHGRGIFIWEDGEYYLGYWANDKREGEGTNAYSNGNIYQGNYKNGKKEGNGIYKWKNGDKYRGKWKNDMKDGRGIYEYSNGDVYDGFFKMDKIDVNSTYTWSNKNNYKGKFNNNLID